jgi:phosphatidylserine decarboxylase
MDISYWCPNESSLKKERIYGEKWLRFSYENLLGRIGLWAMVKRTWFSKWYGSQMNRTKSREKIKPFIKNYDLDESEFLSSADSYRTFNEFFYRKLRPEARPIDRDEHSVVFPADGRHFVIPDLSKIKQVYAKGQSFDLPSLFGSSELAKPYSNGSMIISRLCPVDYHRFHFPVSGKISDSTLLNGTLFSVSPIALRKRLSIFWENKRYLSFLENDTIGNVVQFLIGATCVGSVHLSESKNSFVQKGQEYGYFSFGGSCVITIFPPSTISFSEHILGWSEKGIEAYGKMGEKVGVITCI